MPDLTCPGMASVYGLQKNVGVELGLTGVLARRVLTNTQWLFFMHSEILDCLRLVGSNVEECWKFVAY